MVELQTTLVTKDRLRLFLMIIISISSCAIPNELDPPGESCEDQLIVNKSIEEIKELAAGSAILITEDWILEGYIISSDQAGNFFNTLHIQDGPLENPQGAQIEIELRDSYLQYPLGTKIYVLLRGLHVDVSNGMLKIGSARNNFGSLSISRIPTLKLDQHLIRACDEPNEMQGRPEKINSLKTELIGTLVKIEQVEFFPEVLGLSYAEEGQESERKFRDCDENTMTLLNSGYSDFQADLLPVGNGTVSGVLSKKGNNYRIKIRDTNDLMFESIRCVNLFPLSTSSDIFISEIADPDNNHKARFIELYNSGDEPLSLSGWSLRRYSNDNTHSTALFDLSGSTIGSERTLVIASNDSVFQEVFQRRADLVAGSNSVADSNGDDNIELVDPFGDVVDQFGIPGEDGTGTNHEFEDGGAFRKPSISMGSPSYIFQEWLVYNDSGDEGTVLSTLNAPEDFSPGIR